MKRLFAILLAGGVMAACGTRPEAIVKGTVTGIADSTIIFLYDNEKAKLDSTVVADGKFRFEIANAYPDQAYLFSDGFQRYIPFFVEPGIITATIDPATGFTFTGTPTNDAYKAFSEAQVAIIDKLREFEAKLNAAGTGTPEYDGLVSEYRALVTEYNDFPLSTASKNPNTILTANLIYHHANEFTTAEMVDSAMTIIADAPANAFSDRLKEYRDALANTAVGMAAPDFTQAQPDGTPLSLSSLRGKLVLIDFWASWCGPCRRENPNVVRVYNEYHDKGFEILGVSLDADREAWLKAIEDDGLVWRHVSDIKAWNNAVAKQYGVRSIPHTVLVGSDGVIIAKNLRGEALEAKVAEVLGVSAD